MKFSYYESPAPHFIIDDFYSDGELSDIWKELSFLTNSRTLLSPDETFSAKDGVGNIIKKNSGTFLDSIFDRKISHILTYNRKMFSYELVKEAISKHFIFRYLTLPLKDVTLLSYYQDSDYYEPHIDNATLSACTWLYKEPKQFTGGDFILAEHNYRIPIKNNRTILFPSVFKHAVDAIQMNNKDDPPFSGNGRYVISSFITTTLS